MKLAGYGPQARFGDNNTEEPPWYNIVDNIKWNAWNAQKGVPQEDAMRKFMNLLLDNGVISKIPAEDWQNACPPD